MFAAGSGFPLGNGGRYDGLLTHFGTNVGATGFGLRVDRLLEAMPRKECVQSNVLVLFENNRYIDALQLAENLRQSGKQVTIQSSAALVNTEAFSNTFEQTIVLNNEEA